MNKLYDDPEFREKVQSTKEGIQNIKEHFYKMDEERKKIKSEQDKVLFEMAMLNGAKKRLREQKINIENGVKNAGKMGKAIELQEDINALKNRNKTWENINDKNKSILKVKLTDKEKQMKQIMGEIEEYRGMLREKTKDNNKLSKEAKQLKQMVPKKPDKDISMVEDNDESRENQNIRNDLGIQGGSEEDDEQSDKEKNEVTPKETIGL
jgi:chromosome segregation ATPase